MFPFLLFGLNPSDCAQTNLTIHELGITNTVKLGFKERLDNEQLDNSVVFPVTNMAVHLINSEQIGSVEQLCNNRKVPYYQV